MEIVIGIFSVLLILCAIALIVCITVQDPKSNGLAGAIGGNMGMSAGRSRQSDVLMVKLTKILAIVFGVLVAIVSVLAMLK